jgi:hypothetical protein
MGGLKQLTEGRTPESAEGHNPVPQRCWTAPRRRGYLAVTMSVLASRLDPAPATYRADLRLLEELDEQVAQSRVGSERYVPAAGTRDRAVCLPRRGGEGYGWLRLGPDVRTKAVVTSRGKLTRSGRATGTFMGRAKRLNSSAAHDDGLDCEQLDFGLFPNGDGRPSSKASHLIANNVWPLSCDQKWIDPGRAGTCE